MKKLHSLAFCAVVTPVLTFGAGSLLAGESTDQNIDRQQQNSQLEQGAKQSSPTAAQAKQSADRQKYLMQNRDYISAVPANGMEASNLIGSEVQTTGDEEIGSVSDLIIDNNGQVVAIVVGVGGFLGMGEKDVAIGWGHVTRSGAGDEQELRINVTREDLHSAPEFEDQD